MYRVCRVFSQFFSCMYFRVSAKIRVCISCMYNLKIYFEEHFSNLLEIKFHRNFFPHMFIVWLSEIKELTKDF